MHNIFTAILIVFNCVILLAFKSEGYTLPLYMNLFNILSLPVLYLIISSRAGLPDSELDFDTKSCDIRSMVLKELFGALKQPVVFILYVFPLLLGLLLHQVDSQDYLNYVVPMIINFLIGLNLLAISILLKLYFQKLYYYLISTPGILFAALVTLVGVATSYLLFFGIVLLVITALLSILLFYWAKPLETE